MHRVFVISSIAIAAACSVACGGRGGSEATSTASLTSASVARDDTRPLDERIASALCEHEVECRRPQAAACIQNTQARVNSELSSWDCDPAARRASTEQCLSALRAESCSVDLGARANICPLDVACRNASSSTDDTARMVSPGRALADIWRD